ncbi:MULTISPECIES: Rv3654c family TadE-like protein [Microbacterium]|uniref:Rv3654c family TadE-like protein n=1 Tax=Microbacterium TaxID=33882 RepID=UPI002789120F|nr:MULTISPECIES: Rv3654c family TadE-like protein [Microbacterium]MDQ1084740.1 secretion/DNA translocation related TadE-like protein [Microbacterium sp. SORGH_AS_0344]MDQ1169983.1 secretion/DNA translocation related TadE-like protein [Microbacterium proteolyticum]
MAGTVATVGVVAALAAVTVSLAVVGGAVVEARRVAGVADAAALAAADAASGAVSGSPCERADQVAEVSGLRVDTCEMEGLIATITVGGAYGGIPLDARSRAGPPDATAP